MRRKRRDISGGVKQPGRQAMQVGAPDRGDAGMRGSSVRLPKLRDVKSTVLHAGCQVLAARGF